MAIFAQRWVQGQAITFAKTRSMQADSVNGWDNAEVNDDLHPQYQGSDYVNAQFFSSLFRTLTASVPGIVRWMGGAVNFPASAAPNGKTQVQLGTTSYTSDAIGVALSITNFVAQHLVTTGEDGINGYLKPFRTSTYQIALGAYEVDVASYPGTNYRHRWIMLEVNP